VKKRIVIVGVGALGSHLALLVRNLDASIVVIDFDRVERKNVLSQFHTEMSVGKNKATALQQAMSGLFKVKVEAVPHRLTPDNADALLAKADLVVDCLDNGASRRAVQDLVRAKGIPCLHGALAPDGAFGRVVWDESFAIDDESGAGAATCEDGEHLPFIALVSAFMARAVQRFVQDGRRIGFQVHPGGVTPL
jgi:molybdopterin/thiamine biosynthesis adenylyltransferase